MPANVVGRGLRVGQEHADRPVRAQSAKRLRRRLGTVSIYEQSQDRFQANEPTCETLAKLGHFLSSRQCHKGAIVAGGQIVAVVLREHREQLGFSKVDARNQCQGVD